MKYHPLAVTCENCNCDTKVSISFRADRMVLVETHCPNCQEEARTELDISAVAQMCRESDVDEPEIPELSLLKFEYKGRPC